MPSHYHAAPPDTVWHLLTDPATYDTWADARVERVEPPGPAHAGQVVLMTAGRFGVRLKVRFDVERVDHPAHDLEFRARLLGRELQKGPEESLARLKRAAGEPPGDRSRLEYESLINGARSARAIGGVHGEEPVV